MYHRGGGTRHFTTPRHGAFFTMSPTNTEIPYFDKDRLYQKNPNASFDVAGIRARLLRLKQYEHYSLTDISQISSANADFEQMKAIAMVARNVESSYNELYNMIQSVFQNPEKPYKLHTVGNYFTGCNGVTRSEEACALPCPGALAKPGHEQCSFSVFRAIPNETNSNNIENSLKFHRVSVGDRSAGMALIFVPQDTPFFGIPPKIAKAMEQKHNIQSVRVVKYDPTTLKPEISPDQFRSFENDVGFVNINSLILNTTQKEESSVPETTNDHLEPTAGILLTEEERKISSPVVSLTPTVTPVVKTEEKKTEEKKRSLSPSKATPFWIILVIIVVVVIIVLLIVMIVKTAKRSNSVKNESGQGVVEYNYN